MPIIRINVKYNRTILSYYNNKGVFIFVSGGVAGKGLTYRKCIGILGCNNYIYDTP